MRYEQQLKESEQAELARSVIDKVMKSLGEKKTQDEILAGAVAEVERALNKRRSITSRSCDLRARQEQGHLTHFQCIESPVK